jgi:hypothetical protein
MPFVVGDDDQCLAAGTQVTMGDGAKRAIESIVPGDSVLSNYGGGDLRPARVTDCFAKRRQGQLVCLHLRSGAVVKSTPEHVHFAGYVLGETPQTYFLYLMHKEGVGYRLGTSQVYTAGQARPMVGFKQRALQEHADALWIIRTHASENEARIDEVLTSLRFGLPTCPFVPRKGKGVNGFVHDAAIWGGYSARSTRWSPPNGCWKRWAWTSTGRTTSRKAAIPTGATSSSRCAATGAAAHRCIVSPWWAFHREGSRRPGRHGP